MEQPEKNSLPRLRLIATGGTIASKPTENGLAPRILPSELLEAVPEISEIAQITAIQLMNLDSTDMTPERWLQIADLIRTEYDDYDGFIITHGTDTMGYAAATMYYLIQNSPKPIVFTGAQRSIFERDSDARENLLHAVLYASSPEACGVHVVFGGRVIAGCRARKTRTRSYNAFSSIDYPEVAVFRGRRLCTFLSEKTIAPLRFYHRLNPNVLVIKLIPGMKADIFDYVEKTCDAVIIESFGMGGIPFYEKENFTEKIARLAQHGVRVIVTTQVPHEGSDLSVYQVGRRIREQCALPEVFDMTIEAVVAKTMWALACTDTAEEFRRVFMEPIGADTL